MRLHMDWVEFLLHLAVALLALMRAIGLLD